MRPPFSVLGSLALALTSLAVLPAAPARAQCRPDAVQAVRARWDASRAWADRTLETLMPEQRASQLFTPAAYGYFEGADDPDYLALVDLVEHFGVGGLIFFQGEPMDQAVLTNDLQRRARVPLLISQDMEWGAGMRIGHTTTLPRAMAIGATGRVEDAYRAGQITGLEARALGVHQIYAPDADVNNNPANPIINVRSFGESPAAVGALAAAFACGAQSAGVLATPKHFPGHGDTGTDSHLDLPLLAFDRARLDSVELAPFRRVLGEGGALSVMTGHLAVPALEPDTRVPSTLSPAVIDGLLRRDLGFGGLVVSDAMTMEGVRKHFGAGEAAVRALEAGVDVLLMPPDPYAARAAILAAVASGRLPQTRIDDAVRRILQAKAWAGLDAGRLVDLDAARTVVGAQAHAAFADDVARRSVTLLRNEGGVLPLDAVRLAATGARVAVLTLADTDDRTTGAAFVAAMRRAFPDSLLDVRSLGTNAREADYAEALGAARGAAVVVVPAYVTVRAWGPTFGLPAGHAAFFERLVAGRPPVALVSLGNPYLPLHLAEPDAYVAAYGGETAPRAAVEAILGQAAFMGRLPVTVPGKYARGAGIALPQRAVRVAVRAGDAGFNGRLTARVDSLMAASLAERAFPAASVAVGAGMTVAHLKGYGHFTYESDRRVLPDTPFDMASLTKVIATTTAAMLLYDRGLFDLDAPLARYLPELAATNKRAVTVRQVMLHAAGLRPFIPFHTRGVTTRPALLAAILADSLVYAPGSDSRYSDFGFILIGLAVERISGMTLDAFAAREIFGPLGMANTRFRPVDRAANGQGSGYESVVPTEFDNLYRKRLVQGEVHDETAWTLGGVAGHAGLFSTARDLARFAAMLASNGQVDGRAFIRPETIRLFTTRANVVPGSTRAIGWDTRSDSGYSSAGTRFGPRSFGHTGFTGTSLWVDPARGLWVVLLTNRVYPTRDNTKHSAVRSKIADLAFESLR